MTIDDFILEVKKLNIDIDDSKLDKLNKYYEMLIEYNKVMNLTAITEKEQVYLKHFYDSLTILKIINLNDYNNLCDFGTGAGFPGIVLKIFYPHLNITLIDSLNKRIIFLNEVIDKLSLKNITAIHGRIEEYGLNNREIYDIVTCRAVASTNILLEYAIPITKVGGYFICLKGNMENEPSYNKALEKLKVKEENKIEFSLPFENSKRTIIKFKKDTKTSQLFPRKYKDIKNKPL